VQVKVDPDQKAAQRFHTALRELQRISGKDFETVMKAELGAALAGATRNTIKATKQSIQRNEDRRRAAVYKFDYAGPQSRTGKAYSATEAAQLQKRAAKRRGGRGSGYMLYYHQDHRYPDNIWQGIKEQRKKRVQEKLEARGLAASMFVKIGEALGIEVNAPAYLRKAAHHKKGEMRELIQVMSKGSGKSYEVGFVNNLTRLNKWAKAGMAFRKALNARANFFSRAVKLAASGKIKKTLDRYPGLASQS
jgi:hypothetical protein